MLTVNKLEKIIELEEQLRGEYEQKLLDRDQEIERCKNELEEQRAELQGTIDKQLATIGELSDRATSNSNFEQQNRELSNRSDKLQEEVGTLKKRVKTLQKDLAQEREELKTLKQFDPARMKKNLDAAKKKLVEKNKANDALQKSLNQTKSENARLEASVKEMEAKLEELQSDLEPEEAAEEQAA